MEPYVAVGLILIVVFGFSVYGFVVFLANVFEPKSLPKTRSETSKVPTARGDVQAAARFLNHLRGRNQLSQSDYDRIRDFLERPFVSEGVSLIERIVPATPTGQPSEQQEFKSSSNAVESDADIEQENTKSDQAPIQPSNRPLSGLSSVAESDSVEQIIDAPGELRETAKPKPLVISATSTGMSQVGLGQTGIDKNSKQDIAPWDRPDPPPRPAKRTMSELLAGFMHEKNIRWGELLSGILIVGSAVGLVVSLQEQLRDTIPYFTSLMFMLITAAIHGAGAYTLKQWKLRNTSRGTLIIGLLLIPLNFVAACILSGGEADRRELDDPWLWSAIGVGLISFSVMAWYSSKFLLRKGAIALTCGLIGTCVSILLINRIPVEGASFLKRTLMLLPLALSFLAGTILLVPRQWNKRFWGERVANRAYVVLGIMVFALLAGAALFVVRNSVSSQTFVTMLPLFVVVGIVIAWIGVTIWKSDRAVAVRSSMPESRARATRVSALSVHLLGMFLLLSSLIVSFSNPTALLLTSAVAAAGLLGMALHQKSSILLNIGWVVIAGFMFNAVNLFLGKLVWDDWTSPAQFQEVLVSGHAGLAFLFSGGCVIAAQSAAKRMAWLTPAMQKSGFITGAILVVVGALVALAASLIHPESRFDVITATVLLGVVTVLLAGTCLISCRSGRVIAGIASQQNEQQVIQSVAVAASFSILATLLHVCIWDRGIYLWIDSIAFSSNLHWLIVASLLSLLCTLLAIACFAISGKRLTRLPDSPRDLTFSAIQACGAVVLIACLLGFCVALYFSPLQLGACAAAGILFTVCLLGFAWVTAGQNHANRFWLHCTSAASSLTWVVITRELFTRMEWCPGWEDIRFWLILAIVLLVWSMACLLLVIFGRRSRTFQSLENADSTVQGIVPIVIGAVVVGVVWLQILFGVGRELSADLEPNGWILGNHIPLATIAIGVSAIAVIVSSIRRTSELAATTLGIVWLTGWAWCSCFFVESVSVASSIRWLMPIGGLVTAIMMSLRKPIVTAWVVTRRYLGLNGRSVLSRSQTQQVINVMLGSVTLVLLAITSGTIFKVVVDGTSAGLGGPVDGTLFGNMPKDISFGIPVAILVVTFLIYAMSEKRSWLATAGSMVFQYCVIFAVIILFVSNHPKVATQWFVNILQSVSIGMTAYGLVWWRFKDKISVETSKPIQTEPEKAVWWSAGRWQQIEIHAFTNGLLISSLAIVAATTYFWFPDSPGEWVANIGSLPGLIAWGAFGGLAVAVWKNQIIKARNTSSMLWLIGWMGWVFISMLAAFSDSWQGNENHVPWRSFAILMWGGVTILLGHTLLIVRSWNMQPFAREQSGVVNKQTQPELSREECLWPFTIVLGLVSVFIWKSINESASPFLFYFVPLLLVVGLTSVVGVVLRSGRLAFGAALVLAWGMAQFVSNDPTGLLIHSQPYHVNLIFLSTSCLAMAWLWGGLWLTRATHTNRSVFWMPNLVMLLGSFWVAIGGSGDMVFDGWSTTGTSNAISNFCGLAMVLSLLGLNISQLWNPQRRCWIASIFFLLVGIVLLALVQLPVGTPVKQASVPFCLAGLLALIAAVYRLRQKLPESLARSISRGDRLVASTRWQIPALALLLGVIVIFVGGGTTLIEPNRLQRYLVAASPLGIALTLFLFTHEIQKHWLRRTTLAFLAIGLAYTAWADLAPGNIQRDPSRLLTRSIIVFAGMIFLMGGFFSRWVNAGSLWVKSLKEVSLVSGIFVLVCLFGLVALEYQRFVPDQGCGLSIAEAIPVAMVGLGMVFGLVWLAIKPKNDPFALSIAGRKGYVYLAQATLGMVIAHVYLTMPFLFQLGIKDYWPYIAMLICFGGVGLASLLEQRNLVVLAQPIFNTATLIPVAISILVWSVDSLSDPALVFLLIGMIYLLVSYTNRSILHGAAAILFGNAALWIFYNKFDGFSFFDHPQLWLIPPAVTTLIAAQWCKEQLSKQRLALIRYVCVVTMYISSTSEIFINGVGQELWPPVILAGVATTGILAGMMLRVRAFLYFGFAFLLIAFTAMVSHAHQRFDHVWPWWAFGFTLGVAILVMFGLFEKRRNEMKGVLGRLSEWDY